MTQSDVTKRRAIIVTGPTRGLGLETVRALVRRDSRLDLVLVGRPSEQMEGIRSEVVATDAGAYVVACDFADLTSVRSAAEGIASMIESGQLPALSGLVANAGIQTVDRLHTTAQGLELTFGVNVLAQHLFITGLLPSFAPGARVVLIGSGTHHNDRKKGFVALPRWEDPAALCRPGVGDDASSPDAGQRAYSTSKLCVNYLCHELDRQCGDRLVVNVYDPGMMPGTGLARDMSALRRIAWERVMPRLNPLPGSSTPRRSGEVLSDLVLGVEFRDLRGGYVEIDRIGAPSPESFDENREATLWSTCRSIETELI